MKKTLQDLTIKDNFMFGAVMTDPENCKGLLELLLHKKTGQNHRKYRKKYDLSSRVQRRPS